MYHQRMLSALCNCIFLHATDRCHGSSACLLTEGALIPREVSIISEHGVLASITGRNHIGQIWRRRFRHVGRICSRQTAGSDTTSRFVPLKKNQPKKQTDYLSQQLVARAKWGSSPVRSLQLDPRPLDSRHAEQGGSGFCAGSRSQYHSRG